MIKIMDKKNKKTAKVDRDPVLNKEIKEAAMTTNYKEFLACFFILLVDNGWHKGLKIELANNFTMGQSNYPKAVVAAKKLLRNYITMGNCNYVKQ